jgi:hypothetical protein
MTDFAERDQLKLAISRITTNGIDVVKDTREILHLYNKCGFSLDDDRILPLIGIESETDDIDLDTIDKNLSNWIHENYNSVLSDAKLYIEEILR